MMKPAASPSRYIPSARPAKPPSTAPAIPSSIVTMIPPGSRPGITSFAMAPTTRPNRIQPRMPIDSSRRCHCKDDTASEHEQAVDLEYERAVLEQGETTDRGIALVRINGEELAARLVFPPEAQIAAEAAVGRVELEQRRREHPWRERIVGAGAIQPCREIAGKQTDPIDRDRWIEREVFGDRYTTARITRHSNGAVVEVSV